MSVTPRFGCVFAGGANPDSPRRRTHTDTKGEIVDKRRTGKILFLLAAGASFVLSVSLWFGGDRERGQFVGLWVPSILALGALVMAENRGA
jgi:hypothetical protein